MRPPGVSESRSPNGAPTAHASRIVSVGLPGATVVACASTLWALSDVPLMNVVVYLLYVVGVLLVPGVLTYFVLARQSCLDLNAIAYGGALGLAIELGAFWLGAALALRTLSVIVPLAIGATALVFLRSRRTPLRLPRAPSWRFSFALAGVCVLVLVLGAALYYPGTPLPGDAQ